jgi:hypothetical protein
MKPCNKCSTTKPLTEFHKNKSSLDGYTHVCKDCAIAKSRAWYAANKEKAAATRKAYREENKEACVARAQTWAEENREKSNAMKAAWKKKNPETVRRHAREGARRDPEKQAARKLAYRAENRHVERAYLKKRRAENIHQRVHDSMGNRFRDVLRGKKNGKSWVEFAGYGTKELKAHLESLFLPGMAWENYGTWHIDHKRPVASFDFTVDLEGTARICWALSNLQPLWAVDNMKKGKKWDGVANDHS